MGVGLYVTIHPALKARMTILFATEWGIPKLHMKVKASSVLRARANLTKTRSSGKHILAWQDSLCMLDMWDLHCYICTGNSLRESRSRVASRDSSASEGLNRRRTCADLNGEASNGPSWIDQSKDRCLPNTCNTWLNVSVPTPSRPASCTRKLTGLKLS